MRSALSRYVQELLLSALGAFGCLWALADGLDMPLEVPALLGVCLLAAGATLGLLRLPRGGLVSLGLLPVWGITLWCCRALVVPGGAVAGSAVTIGYSRVFSAVTATYPLQQMTEEEAAFYCTVFFLFLGALAAFLLSRLLYRGHSALFVLVSALPLALPLVIIATPATAPMVLLLGLWCGVLLTAGVRKSDPDEGTRLGWRVLALAWLTVGMLAWLMGVSSVNHHPRFVQELRGRLDAFVAGQEYQTPIYPPAVNLPGAGEFSLGPRRFGGGVVLQVKTDIPGPLYLRVWSGKTFTGSAWLSPDREAQGTAASFAQLGVTLRENGVEKQRVRIRPVTGGELLVTPYGISGTNYQLESTTDAQSAVPAGTDALLLREEVQNAAYWYYTYPLTGVDPATLLLVEDTEEAALARQYLDLPESTRALMEDWTAARGILPPEDDSPGAVLAVAGQIREALREYPYSLDAEAPPQGRELVDWFLEQKTGYCVHFATTAACALRSLGVPARYVSGCYVPRTHGDQWTLVRDRQGHAWVEVYLRGIGWWPLEVTASGSGNPAASPTPGPTASPTPTPVSTPSAAPVPTERPTPAPTLPGNPEDNDVSPGPAEEKQPGTWLLAALVLLAAGLLLIPAAGWLLRELRRFRFRGRDSRKAAHALWRYLLSFYRRGSPPARARELAEKAAFSRRGMTREELEELRRVTRDCVREFESAVPASLRPLWRLWRGM